MILTSRRQQRVLTAMHSALRRSDPRLVAKFMIFTRLTKDEAIPLVERIRRKRLGWLILGWLTSTVRGLTRRFLRWPRRSLIFIPAAAAAVLAVVILAAQGQAQGSCVPVHTGTGNAAAAPQTDPAKCQAIGTDCPSGQVYVTARGR
jgi:hypothetical protein